MWTASGIVVCTATGYVFVVTFSVIPSAQTRALARAYLSVIRYHGIAYEGLRARVV